MDKDLGFCGSRCIGFVKLLEGLDCKNNTWLGCMIDGVNCIDLTVKNPPDLGRSTVTGISTGDLAFLKVELVYQRDMTSQYE